MKFSLSFTVYSLQLKKMKKIQTTMQFMRFIGLDRLNRHAGLMACAVFFTLHSSLLLPAPQSWKVPKIIREYSYG